MRNVATPICSVCIANYNGIGIIDNCIRSVLEQEGDLSVEIIIHDDASNDGSAEYIRTHYPNVKLIESKENVGFCISNNRMVEASHGQFILLLNNDAELFPNALCTLLDAAQIAGNPSILGLPQYDASNGELIDRGSLFDPFLNPIPNLNMQCSEVGMIMGACLWMPRSLWIELGGFPKWFGSLAEDMYLSCLARLWGYPVCVLPDSGFRHWVGMSFGGGKVLDKRLVTSTKRRALSERNKTFVMVLIYPAVIFHLIFPLHLLMLLLEGTFLALINLNLKIFHEIYWNCFKCLWHERGRLLKLRRELQTRRAIGIRNFLRVFTPLPHKLRMLIRHGFPQII
jgi:GT2 family glycosyltransferase